MTGPADLPQDASPAARHDPDGVLATSPLPGEDQLDASLRPRRLDQFVGQRRVRRQLDVVIRGAIMRDLPVDHLLFSGPPGLGKTSLAAIVANEVGALLRHTSGPALERPGDLAAILTNLEPGDVLFVDEVHRLPRTVEEVLYPAMEDFQLDIVVGKGPSARSIRLGLPRFTLIGATTRTGLIATPLRDRFGFSAHLDYYATDDLQAIVARSAGLLDIPVSDDGAHEIARRSRGTPRIANRLLRRVRDYAEVEADGTVDAGIARDALAVFDVDEVGLDRLDRRVLEAIVVRFDSGPVGLATLATSVGEETDTVEDTVEPFLLQLGFIQRTPRGRVATPAGRSHVRADPNPSTLFDPSS